MQVCALINVRLARHGDETRVDFEQFIADRPEVMECDPDPLFVDRSRKYSFYNQ